MTFDELEECWENDVPEDHHIPPTDLRQHVFATASRAELRATIFELWAMSIFSLFGVLMLVDTIRDANPWHCYPAPLITLGIAFFVYSARRRRRLQLDFSGSLAEIIEGRLRALDTHIGRVQAFFWWFIVPVTLAVGVNFVFNFDGRPLWVSGILPLAVTAVWLAMKMEIRASHLRHRKILRSIQRGLTSDA